MEKIKKFMNTLKFKWLKDTLGTAIIIAVLIIIFIAINVIIQKIDIADIDITEEGLYSLTDESKEAIEKIPEEDKFEIYMFDYDDGNTLIDFLKEYTRINKNITLESVKSSDRPDLVSKYEVMENYGSIVIVCGERKLTFNSYDLYNYDMQTGAYTDITEQRITNGIIGLSSIGKSKKVYELTGHGEISMNTEMTLLKTYLELENFEITELDLLKVLSVPEDCDTLMIASPSKDITEFERDELKKYIDKGGDIFWLCNPYSSEKETPNLDSVLDLFGVKMRQDGFMLEQNKSRMIMSAPDLILPSIGYSQATSEISTVLLLDSGRLEIADDDKLTELSCQRTDLLTTSPDSFFRTDLSLGFYAKTEEEIAEETVTGCLMEKSVQDGNETSKLIVIANNLFAQDQTIPVGNSVSPAIGFYENLDFTLNCIGDLAEVEDTMIIRKDIEMVPYTATETQDLIIKIIIFSVPVLIIIAGIIVWSIRRRKK